MPIPKIFNMIDDVSRAWLIGVLGGASLALAIVGLALALLA